MPNYETPRSQHIVDKNIFDTLQVEVDDFLKDEDGRPTVEITIDQIEAEPVVDVI